MSTDSWRAASMKAQVLTTTRSASSGESAASKPSPVRVPTNLSESTWFFGQPKVSIQYRSATGPIYRGGARRRPGPTCGTEASPARLGPLVVEGPVADTAEREGFEPSDPVTQVNSLAVSPIRPLSHLSLPLRPKLAYHFRGWKAGQDVETSQGYRNGPAVRHGEASVPGEFIGSCPPGRDTPGPTWVHTRALRSIQMTTMGKGWTSRVAAAVAWRC